ncbi:MAG: sigma-54-dependent Fis family transcriptional regulator [Gemmatimonadetes bacterium]|nr:sigma-54-dependent Fis family transcriptional regulator [Gemmatimonadota bacterium]
MNESPRQGRILVVDDSPETLELVQRNLQAERYTVYLASSVADAIEFLTSTSIDLVITDLKMPKVSGLDLVRHVRENLKDTEVVMMTGYPSVGSAVEAVKGGAHAYLSKPFTDQELLSAVREALDKLRTRRLVDQNTQPAPRSGSIVGESSAIRDVLREVAKAAKTSATVLITGESGTGKELLARAIHYDGPRAQAPFVPINCGGIPEGLLESELFGHMKGAFTGATTSRAGFFQTADGGTLFLDEVSELSAAMQVKLLRVLQEKEVLMVGSSRPQKIDVRIVAATNKNLHHLVEKRLFREDLFFRINVITIDVPPLRDRGDDVLVLVQYFARKFAREHGRSLPHFSDEVLRCMKDYRWQGNIRELENTIQRLIVMTESDRIEITDLPSFMRFSAPHGTGLDRTLAAVEAEHIRNVLAGAGGNKTRAAEILGIDRKTLREKLKGREEAGPKGP